MVVGGSLLGVPGIGDGVGVGVTGLPGGVPGFAGCVLPGSDKYCFTASSALPMARASKTFAILCAYKLAMY